MNILCHFSMDATDEPVQGPKLGRLVNHGDMASQRNARMKIVEGPVLALYATKTIATGEQILYDYGVPIRWTDKVCY